MGTSLSRALTRCREVEDATVRTELYTWSNEEFCDEYALIYTCRSNPSHTCVSHFRVIRNKVIFTFHDRLCEGNTVKLDMEFERDTVCRGFAVFRNSLADKSSGNFIERMVHADIFHFSYEDKLRHIKGQLHGYPVNRGEFEVQFITGFEAGSILKYYIRIIGHPLKGIDVDLSSPYCEFDNCDNIQRIGLCSINHVSGMPPPRDVVKQKKQRKDAIGAILVPAQNNNVILNSGQTQGNFNGSNFKDCHITVDAQAIKFRGLFRRA